MCLVTAYDNQKLHSLDPRPCSMCGRVYSNLSNLRQHIRLIHNPTHVRCPICNKTFKSSLYLKRHLVTCRYNHGQTKFSVKQLLHKIKENEVSNQNQINYYKDQTHVIIPSNANNDTDMSDCFVNNLNETYNNYEIDSQITNENLSV